MPDPFTVAIASNFLGNISAGGVVKALEYLPHIFGDRDCQSEPLPDLEFSKNKELVASKSYASAFDKIMVALKDDKVNTIGLWGLGGAGKTTLVTQVGYTAKLLQLFQKVIAVVVSRTPDIGKIQDKIANSFGLKLKKTTPGEKAVELWFQLEKEEKVLLILDDMWSELHLKDIGVPFAENRKGCKIILTTRGRQVCNSMKCQETVPLGVLEKDEAWTMFEKYASLENASPDIIEVAKEVAEKCGGLPIAIVTLARALSTKDLNGWELARLKLERSRTKEFPKDVENNVYRCLEASYNYLERSETKKCFLLCGLYPEDYLINVEDLVIFAWGLRLYQNAESIQEVRLEVFEAIKNLKGCGLLLEGFDETFFSEDEKGYVRVHDVVRDVARWIASKEDNGFLTKSGVESENENSNQKLEIQLLHHYDSEISFEGLWELKVLDLECGWDVEFFSLNALKSLTNLRALQLNHFEQIVGISALANLTKLEILRILGAKFHESIEELGELKNLRLLDLRHCHFELGFSPNLIRRLVKLEELYLYPSSIQMSDISTVIVPELNILSRSISLSLKVPSLDFPKDFVFPRLERYNIVINTRGQYTSKEISSRSLSISGGLPFKVISKLLWNVELLRVSNIKNSDVKCLIDTTAGDVPVATILQNLREVRIDSCLHLQVIFQHNKADNQKQLLSKLKVLHLRSLPMLEFIWKMPTQHISLQSLEDVKIYGCGKLKSLFSFSLAQSLELRYPICLPKLRYLEISSCWSLEYVFPNFMVLPPLEKLVLTDLLQLKQICNPARQREEHGIWLLPHLQHLELKDCPEFNDAIHSKSESTNLERNLIRDEDHGPTQYDSLPNLKVVRIERCNKLESLFTSSLIPSLKLLKELSLSQCKKLETVFMELESTDETESKKMLCLPTLETLKITECPTLKSVLPLSSAPGLSRLKVLELRRLPKLSGFGPKNYVIKASNLKHLEVTDDTNQKVKPPRSILFGGSCVKLDGLIWKQQIWKGPLQDVVTNLTEMEVYDCKRLTHVFPATLVRNLQQLNKLKIRRCEKLEQIIVNNDDMSASSSQGYGQKNNKGMLTFPHLKELCLESLPCLTKFSPMGYDLVFPSLEKLHIKNCFQMTTSFTVDSTSFLHAKTKKNIIPEVDLGGSTSLKNCKDLGWSADTTEDHMQTNGMFTSLVIKNLRILDIVSLSPVAQNLKQLIVQDSDKLEEIFEIDELLNSRQEDQALLLSHLECLELVSVSELRWILKGPTQYVSLSNLNVIKIEKCNKLVSLFPSSLIPSLRMLKELSISCCEKLETVFMELESADETESNTLCLPTLETLEITECPALKHVLPLSSARGLPRLKTLKLLHLPNLSNFGPENYVMKAPDLKLLEVTDQQDKSLLSNRFGRPNVLDGRIWQQHIWKGPLQVVVTNLTDLEVYDCKRLTCVFPVTLVRNLQQLNKLKIKRCEKLEQIIANDDDMSASSSQGYGEKSNKGMSIFPQLKELCLENLPCLTKFSPMGYHLVFPSLEKLHIEDCFQMTTSFTVDSTSFLHAKTKENLIPKVDLGGSTSLNLKNCKDLGWSADTTEDHVQTSGMFTSLVIKNLRMLDIVSLYPVAHNLKQLIVQDSDKLEEVFEIDELLSSRQEDQAPLLAHLECLELVSVSELRWILKGPTQYVSLSNLNIIKIEECNKLESLFPSSLIPGLRLLKKLSISCCKKLETIFMELESADETESNTLCLPTLETLQIIECPTLKYVLPLSSASDLHCLQMLELRLLPKLSSFGPENYVIEAPNLKHLEVTDETNQGKLRPSFLPYGYGVKLDGRIWQQHIWKGPLQVVVTNLTEMEVYDCKRLTHVFLVTLVRNLQQLNKLKIRRCEKLEQIIVDDDDMSTSSSQGYGKKNNKGMLIFPQLKELCLSRLPCITRFSPVDYHLVFPSLKKLMIEGCFQMITSFTMDSTLTVCAKTKKNLIPEVDLGGSTSLNLKNCKDLGWSADTREDHVQTSGTFTSLERLVIKDLRILDIVSLYSAAQNLKQLIVKDCDKLEEVFEIDELLNSKHEDQAPLLSLLECLELVSLCELRWILKGPTQYVSLSNLNVVKIEKCNKLETLFPSSLIPSLSLLKTLSISRCKKLETVFMELESTDETESNTLCLPTLETLKIIECPTLKYVLPLSSAPGLPRLKVLELRRLPKLSGFGQENYVIKAPNLKHLEVTDNTNQKVKPPRSILRLQDGSCVKLDGLIWKQQIWKGPLKVVVTNLTEMEVYDCKRLTHVFPVTLVRNLEQLNKLKIRKCEKLKQIIVDDEDMSASSSQGYGKKNNKAILTFPQLKELCLENLPYLTRFSPIGDHLVFSFLEYLEIKDCLLMVTSFSVDSTLSVHAKTKAPRLVEKETILEESTTIKESEESDDTWGGDILWYREFYPDTLPPYVEESEEISAVE